MDVNCCHEIDAASHETMLILSDLIEASRTEEQMVYREAEIDELWRLLVRQRAGAMGAEAAAIGTVIDSVMIVHDLLENPGNARQAAERLRALAA